LRAFCERGEIWPARVSGQRLGTMKGLLFSMKRNTTKMMSCNPDVNILIVSLSPEGPCIPHTRASLL